MTICCKRHVQAGSLLGKGTRRYRINSVDSLSQMKSKRRLLYLWAGPSFPFLGPKGDANMDCCVVSLTLAHAITTSAIYSPHGRLLVGSCGATNAHAQLALNQLLASCDC